MNRLLRPQWLPRPSPAALTLSVLVMALLASFTVALFSGAVKVPLPRMLDALRSLFVSDAAAPDPSLAIITIIRLPRLVLACLVGSSLAVAGAAMQGLFRNPLADPGLIGVSSGAALGAVCSIVLGSYLPWLTGVAGLPLAASLGGLLATLSVYWLARHAQHTDVATLLLAGIAINAIAGAGTGLATYVADDVELRNLTFWLMGSLGGGDWSQLAIAAPIMLVASAILCTFGQPLNAFLVGENVAHHLGYRVERFKLATIFLCAIAVGTAVSMSGIIGFVGLVVPHILRLAIGADHRLLLPASALLGAIGLLIADTVARTIVSPAELPIGILTTLLGGPFFLYLLIRQRAFS